MSATNPGVSGETFPSASPAPSNNLVDTVNPPPPALSKTTEATSVSLEVPPTTPSDDITSQISTMSQTVIIVDGPQTTFITSTTSSAPSNPPTTPTITVQAQSGPQTLTLTFTAADNTFHTIVAVLPGVPAPTTGTLAPTPEPSILLIPPWPEVKKAKLEGIPGIIFGCVFGGFIVAAAVALYVWRRRKDKQWVARNKELTAMYGPDNWVPPENRPPRRVYVGRGEEMGWERPMDVQELMSVYGRPADRAPIAMPQRAAQAAEKGTCNEGAAVRELAFSYTPHHVATQRYLAETHQIILAEHNFGFQFQQYTRVRPFGSPLTKGESPMKLPAILRRGKSRDRTRISKRPSHDHTEDTTPQIPQPAAIVPFHAKRPPAKVIRDENGLFVVVPPENGSHDDSPSFDRLSDSGIGVPEISLTTRPFNDGSFGTPDERLQERTTETAHLSEVISAPFLSDPLTQLKSVQRSSGYPFPQMSSVYDASDSGIGLLQVPTERPYTERRRSPSPLPSRYRLRAGSAARPSPLRSTSPNPAITRPTSPVRTIRPPTDYSHETPIETFHRRRGSGGWRPPPGYIPKRKSLPDSDLHADWPDDDEEIFTRLRAEKKPAFPHHHHRHATNPLARKPSAEHPNLNGWKFPATEEEGGSCETTRSAEFMRGRATTAATDDAAAEHSGWWKRGRSAKAQAEEEGAETTYEEFVAQMAGQLMLQSTAGEWWQGDDLAQNTAEMSEEEKDVEELGRVRELVAEKEAQLKCWETQLGRGAREREDAKMREEAAMAAKMREDAIVAKITRHDEEMKMCKEAAMRDGVKMREEAAMKVARERKVGRLGRETGPGEFGLASPDGLVQFARRRG